MRESPFAERGAYRGLIAELCTMSLRSLRSDPMSGRRKDKFSELPRGRNTLGKGTVDPISADQQEENEPVDASVRSGAEHGRCPKCADFTSAGLNRDNSL